MRRQLGILLTVVAVAGIVGTLVWLKQDKGKGGAAGSSGAGDQEAVRAAIESYLTQRAGLNLSAMDMSIAKLDVSGDTAQAQVEFKAKGNDAKMDVTYDLTRQNGVWTVQKSSGIGASGHPPVGTAPPPGNSSDQTQAMPPGHPPVGGPASPPVHGTGNPTQKP